MGLLDDYRLYNEKGPGKVSVNALVNTDPSDPPLNITGSVTISAASTPKIYNITTGLANVENSQALTTGTKKFLFRVRGSSAKAQVAFSSGDTSTNFVTIPKGATYEENNLELTSGFTIYFQLDFPTQEVEILEWS